MASAQLLVIQHILDVFMVIMLILVACCSRLGLIYAIRVLYCKFYLNLHVQVTLTMIYRIDLLVFDHSFIPIDVLIKFDHLGSIGLSSVKSDLMLDRLSMNALVGGASLMFDQGV
jgi:hypothetical protein